MHCQRLVVIFLILKWAPEPTFLLGANSAQAMEVTDKLKSLVTTELEWVGLELIDLKLKGKPGRFRLCITADKDSGILVDECADLSRRLSRMTELDQLLGANYQLEISSPGMDRPLRTESEFRMKIGRFLEVTYSDNRIERRVKGKLSDVLQDGIYLDLEDSTEFIQYSQISNAVQALPW